MTDKKRGKRGAMSIDVVVAIARCKKDKYGCGIDYARQKFAQRREYIAALLRRRRVISWIIGCVLKCVETGCVPIFTASTKNL